MVRRIRGLKWARELGAKKPACIGSSRPRGAKALGVRYEKALARELPEAEHGIWFEYEDENGYGYCQVDFFLNVCVAPSLQSQLVVMEAKYTWTREGHEQMEALYGPILRATRRLQEPPATVLVCRSLTKETKQVVWRVAGSLEEALALAKPGRKVVLQWLPSTPLRALGQSPGKAA